MYKRNAHPIAGGTGPVMNRIAAPARHGIRSTPCACNLNGQPCTDAGGIVGTGVIHEPSSVLP